MKKQIPAIKNLLRDLEAGKKRLKSEYEKSVKALNEAIRTLEQSNLDETELLKLSQKDRKPGRPRKGSVNLKLLVREKRSRRGRPSKDSVSFKGNLTQLLFDTISMRRKFMHNRDIVELIEKQVPQTDHVAFSKKVSVLLASLKRQGRLITFQDGGYRRNMYWGLPAWMNGEGKIIKGREFPKAKE